MIDGTVWLIGNAEMTPVTGKLGTTPNCPDAKFQRGDVVKIRNKKSLRHFPREAVIAVAIPPGFSPDNALSDLLNEPRKLMVQVGSKSITYILVQEGNPVPYLIKERDILPSGKPKIEIGTVTRDNAEAMDVQEPVA